VINEAKGNGKVIWENLNLPGRGAEKSKKQPELKGSWDSNLRLQFHIHHL
jgi:hypothetical protein